MLLVVIVLQSKRYQINTLEPETYTVLYVNYISIKLRKKLLKNLHDMYYFLGTILSTLEIFFCCCSVRKLRPAFRHPMDCGMPSFPVHYL